MLVPYFRRVRYDVPREHIRALYVSLCLSLTLSLAHSLARAHSLALPLAPSCSDILFSSFYLLCSPCFLETSLGANVSSISPSATQSVTGLPGVALLESAKKNVETRSFYLSLVSFSPYNLRVNTRKTLTRTVALSRRKTLNRNIRRHLSARQ